MRMLKYLAGALACSFVLAGVGAANPVPEAVAKEFRDLVRRTARSGKCPDAQRLAERFGSFGLDLLGPKDLVELERRFHVFAPILVESQRPGHRPDFAVQDLYRKHADTTEGEAMKRALREWFTATLTEAPPSGMMRIVLPPEGLRKSVRGTRVTVSEMLASWGDEEARPLMGCLASDTLTADQRWRLERSREQLDDPTARTFILVRPDRSVQLCETIEEVKEAIVRRGSLDGGQTRYALARSEIRDLMGMVAECVVGENTNWGGHNFCVVLEFADGVRASLSPTERGHVVYRDNASLDYRRTLRLRSERLWTWIREVLHRELGEEVQ